MALRRGWRQKCPSCGNGAVYRSYLKVADSCGSCGEELHHHRADDAPAYFTMLIVGHVMVGLALVVEKRFHPEMWVHFALWLPLCLGMTLWMLPRIKASLVGYQWALRMHGFDTSPDPSAPEGWPTGGSEQRR